MVTYSSISNFIGFLVRCNNQRVNASIGSLYDDNKSFTEQILISEDKRMRVRLSVYFLLEFIDIN